MAPLTLATVFASMLPQAPTNGWPLLFVCILSTFRRNASVDADFTARARGDIGHAAAAVSMSNTQNRGLENSAGIVTFRHFVVYIL
jgi:hypothetical protein